MCWDLEYIARNFIESIAYTERKDITCEQALSGIEGENILNVKEIKNKWKTLLS